MQTVVNPGRLLSDHCKAVPLEACRVTVQSVQLPEEIEIKRTPLCAFTKEKSKVEITKVAFSAKLKTQKNCNNILTILGLSDELASLDYLEIDSIKISIEEPKERKTADLLLTLRYTGGTYYKVNRDVFLTDSDTGEIYQPQSLSKFPRNKSISVDHKIFTELYLAILNSNDNTNKTTLLDFLEEKFPDYVEQARQNIRQRLASKKQRHLENLERQRSKSDMRKAGPLESMQLPSIPD